MLVEESYLIFIDCVLLVYSGSESRLELLLKGRGTDGTKTNGSNPPKKVKKE